MVKHLTQGGHPFADLSWVTLSIFYLIEWVKNGFSSDKIFNMLVVRDTRAIGEFIKQLVASLIRRGRD